MGGKIKRCKEKWGDRKMGPGYCTFHPSEQHNPLKRNGLLNFLPCFQGDFRGKPFVGLRRKVIAPHQVFSPTPAFFQPNNYFPSSSLSLHSLPLLLPKQINPKGKT